MMASGTLARRASESRGAGRGPSVWRSRARRDQLVAGMAGVALLAGSVLMRRGLVSMRSPQGEGQVQLVREDPESQRTLESLAVTFPRLVLGGMRGLVSTYLWIEAENDKNDRKWEQLERRYDVIGALQPYFSSVYIYHAWNQAYNLSAQWQEEDNKYKWVLDGLAYLQKGEDFNPGNPDIILEEAHMYFLKIGGAFERIFYREHWREDMARLHDLNDVVAVKGDSNEGLREVRDIILHKDPRDQSNYLHIELLHNPAGGSATGWGIQITDPADPADAKNNPTGFNLFKGRTDGKKATDPVEFRYGVSPFYFAYIEYRRMLSLPTTPTYMSTHVIDSFPAMSLRLWCRDDIFYMGQIMDWMFGPHMDPKLLADKDRMQARINEVSDCARNVAMIGPRAVDLFDQHLAKYPEDIRINKKHIMETQAYIAVAPAEYRLFTTLLDWRNGGEKLTPALIQSFQEADDLYKNAAQVTQAWVDGMYPLVEGQPVNPDRDDAERYVYALQNRSRGIEAILTAPPGQAVDFGFLDFIKQNVVER